MFEITSAPSELKDYKLLEYEFRQTMGQIGLFRLHYGPLMSREARSFFADVKSLNGVYGKTMKFKCYDWNYEGIITKIDSIDRDDHVFVYVYDKTWILLHHISCQTFANQGIKDIATKLTDGSCSVKVSSAASGHKQKFFIQMNESNFNALAKLVASCGCQFWYNGTEICIGNDNENSKTLEIETLHNCTVHANLGKSALSVTTHTLSDKSSVAEEVTIASLEGGIQTALKKASESGKKSLYHLLREDGSFKNGKMYGEYLLRNVLSERMIFEASSHKVLVVGDKIVIKDTKGLSETFIVESVIGHADDGNLCTFSFVATNIVAAATFDEQKTHYSVAKVIATNDDANRVKVTFDWDANGIQSPWLRLLTPSWGKGHGLYIPPAIDDHVVVIWGTDSMEPIVLGAIAVATHTDKPKSVFSFKTSTKQEIHIADDTIELVNDKTSFKIMKDSIELTADNIKLTAPKFTMECSDALKLSSAKLELDSSDKIKIAATTLNLESTQGTFKATTLKLDASQISA